MSVGKVVVVVAMMVCVTAVTIAMKDPRILFLGVMGVGVICFWCD